MTNKTSIIISALKTRLLSAGLFVLRYPDDLKSVGNRYPVVFIREGDKSFEPTRGNRYEYTQTLTLILAGAYTQNRMSQMNTLQKKVYDAILQDPSLGGLVMNVNPTATNTGEVIRDTGVLGYAGHNEAVAYREIVLNILVQDARR